MTGSVARLSVGPREKRTPLVSPPGTPMAESTLLASSEQPCQVSPVTSLPTVKLKVCEEM